MCRERLVRHETERGAALSPGNTGFAAVASVGYNERWRAPAHCGMVYLVRSGTKQPKPFTASAADQARLLSSLHRSLPLHRSGLLPAGLPAYPFCRGACRWFCAFQQEFSSISSVLYLSVFFFANTVSFLLYFHNRNDYSDDFKRCQCLLLSCQKALLLLSSR